MSVQITIQGTVIDIPSTSASPDWSAGIIQAFQAIEGALASSAGTYDIAPQVLIIDGGTSSFTDITNLSFPTANVRGAFIRYSMYRSDTLNVAYESGELEVVYNTSAGTWEMSRSYTGDGKIQFQITNTGQVQYALIAFASPGTNHVGNLAYQANALQNA
jgi:hypothetical protein